MLLRCFQNVSDLHAFSKVLPHRSEFVTPSALAFWSLGFNQVSSHQISSDRIRSMDGTRSDYTTRFCTGAFRPKVREQLGLQLLPGWVFWSIQGSNSSGHTGHTLHFGHLFNIIEFILIYFNLTFMNFGEHWNSNEINLFSGIPVHYTLNIFESCWTQFNGMLSASDWAAAADCRTCCILGRSASWHGQWLIETYWDNASRYILEVLRGFSQITTWYHQVTHGHTIAIHSPHSHRPLEDPSGLERLLLMLPPGYQGSSQIFLIWQLLTPNLERFSRLYELLYHTISCYVFPTGPWHVHCTQDASWHV